MTGVLTAVLVAMMGGDAWVTMCASVRMGFSAKIMLSNSGASFSITYIANIGAQPRRIDRREAAGQYGVVLQRVVCAQHGRVVNGVQVPCRRTAHGNMNQLLPEANSGAEAKPRRAADRGSSEAATVTDRGEERPKGTGRRYGGREHSDRQR